MGVKRVKQNFPNIIKWEPSDFVILKNKIIKKINFVFWFWNFIFFYFDCVFFIKNRKRVFNLFNNKCGLTFIFLCLILIILNINLKRYVWKCVKYKCNKTWLCVYSLSNKSWFRKLDKRNKLYFRALSWMKVDGKNMFIWHKSRWKNMQYLYNTI